LDLEPLVGRSVGNSNSGEGRPDGFYHNNFGQLLTDGETGITDLADEIRLARQKLDDVILTKPELAQSMLDFRFRTQLLYPHGHSRFDSA